jgi:hypothetical protein
MKPFRLYWSSRMTNRFKVLWKKPSGKADSIRLCAVRRRSGHLAAVSEKARTVPW